MADRNDISMKTIVEDHTNSSAEAAALAQSTSPTTIDLFCGAGGITEGFRQAGFRCLYGNDLMPEAIETFKLNHPSALADCRPIETVDPEEIMKKLGLQKGQLDVLVFVNICIGLCM